jgi:hypothetical protein
MRAAGPPQGSSPLGGTSRSDARGDHSTKALSLSAQVALIERKLEVRRERTRRHWREMQSDVREIAERGARWAPLVGVAAVTWFGFKLARPQGGASAFGARRVASAGIWAPLVALVTTGLRIAFSPQGRELLDAWRRGRAKAL